MKNHYVYMMTNKYNNVLYAGVTSDLIKRIYQHKHKVHLGFTNRYNVDKLVYYEVYEDPDTAIKREKTIKNLLRRKKIDLFKRMNPNFEDLYKEILSSS
ncbi:excinuclease ABC subunit C [Candidatus Curtissbacteria bacterium RIFCSPLOWO2_01_FULL_42_26]|uniref:Excinuclease ABC subunit C n=1 Tax=Candidatus Curtissbacteria bacterium RIFCSPLOWO2_01_FULL_42_26 TaxID=1797729 RepID=A0A1F5I3T3_9BACT|nr:MAG: excinuclease ABC subunit C [Candidatus Curtissbacteria bacterium RIFCSPLOWO2_01_FULL_42_26]